MRPEIWNDIFEHSSKCRGAAGQLSGFHNDVIELINHLRLANRGSRQLRTGTLDTSPSEIHDERREAREVHIEHGAATRTLDIPPIEAFQTRALDTDGRADQATQKPNPPLPQHMGMQRLLQQTPVPGAVREIQAWSVISRGIDGESYGYMLPLQTHEPSSFVPPRVIQGIAARNREQETQTWGLVRRGIDGKLHGYTPPIQAHELHSSDTGRVLQEIAIRNWEREILTWGEARRGIDGKLYGYTPPIQAQSEQVPLDQIAQSLSRIVKGYERKDTNSTKY